ncbi:MAG: helix-hairpin-helix domain-containing protein [Desulfocapsa sp.]|nr:helix-hairpin-helix domain-containing protein [Desulfocapsa sp.]
MNSGELKTIKNQKLGKKGSGRELFALYCCTIFLLSLLIGNSDFFTVHSEDKPHFLSLKGETIFLEKEVGQTYQDQSNFILSYQNHTLAPFFFAPIAINHSNKTLLMSIKGIGPGLAESILQTREEIGRFSVPEDLLEVSGIGPARLRKFTPYFSFLN